MYVNCKADDLLREVKVSSILGYVFQSLGLSGRESAINQESGTNNVTARNDKSGTNNLTAMNEESETNNVTAWNDKSGTNDGSVMNQESGTNNLTAMNEESETNNVTARNDKSGTNDGSKMNQESGTNNLTAMNQECGTNNVTARNDKSGTNDGSVMNQEDTYRKYCVTLGGKLGGYDPYERFKEISTTSHQQFYTAIKDIIPQEKNTAEYDKIVSTAAGLLEEVGRLPEWEHAEHSTFRWDNKEKSSSFFTVQISRSGENLEIIPTYLSISSRKHVASVFTRRSEKNRTTINYKQRKYYLTKFDIQAITEKIKTKY